MMLLILDKNPILAANLVPSKLKFKQLLELSQLICSAGISGVYKKIPQGKEIQNWKDANKPTGICETCTAKSIQEVDIYRSVLTSIKHIVNHSEQIPCLNSDEIKKINETFNAMTKELRKLKEV